MKEFRSKLFGEHDPYKDFHPMPPDMQGWASDRPVFREVLTELKPKFIVEVGTWKGMSAFHMADLLLEMGHRDFELKCMVQFIQFFVMVDRSYTNSSCQM
jgi:cephalosporin hydroxylase